MSRRFLLVSLLAASTLLLGGCPKDKQNYSAGERAESLQDYDTAIVSYEHALKADPFNAQYKVKVARLRLEGGEYHVKNGQKALADGNLTLALAEFQKAKALDPSSAAADQEIQITLERIYKENPAEAPQPAVPSAAGDSELLSMPPELKPLSREPINLKMTNDAKIVFETIAKLAGLSVIFDPDFNTRRITVELPNVTLEQALDAVALESKAFWKPVTGSIIMVAPDQPQKRRDLEDQVVRTFYLSNTLTPQDLTEIITGLRQLLDLKRLQQVNSQNAIVIRDTPDKVQLAERIIRNIDKARPEIVLSVEVLEVRTDRMHDLGINPGTSATVAFSPRSALNPNGTTSTTGTTTTGTTTGSTTTSVSLNNLKHLQLQDFSVTLPGVAVTALLTDSATKIIQDPEIRTSDGQPAKLRIGDKVPIATGSFQAGVGVGAVGGAGGVVNPLVNTQFQYQDVGVNIDVTPRVHPNGDISLKLKVEVSSVTGTSMIGGISQPIISQRTVEHDIRLKEGETSILGGLRQHTETASQSGWPGFSSLPFFLKYFFSDNTKDVQDNEVLIVMTPHIIRLPAITADNVRAIAAGTDTNARVFHEENDGAPQPAPPPAPEKKPSGLGAAALPAPGSARASAQPIAESSPTMLRFEPATLNMKTGDTTTIGLSVQNAKDLFSIPLLLQYDAAVIQIDDVRNGGFLSGGTQEIAIVQRVDAQRGQAIISATRQPNTPGINGSGTLLGIVVRAVAPGTSAIQIVQVNARDSQQKALAFSSGAVTVQVK